MLIDFMKKLIFILFILLILPNVSANNFTSGATLSAIPLNATITFSIPANIDHVFIDSGSILMENVTTSLVFCPIINYTTPNSALDSAAFSCGGSEGGGGSSYVPPEEEVATITCSISSVEAMNICLKHAGSAVWPGYPNAGVLILFLLNYILLLLIALNKERFKGLVTFLTIALSVLFIIVTLVAFIWLLQDCEINQLGEVNECLLSFGNNVWPSYPKVGLTVAIILFVVIIVFILLIRRKRKLDSSKKDLNSNII